MKNCLQYRIKQAAALSTVSELINVEQFCTVFIRMKKSIVIWLYTYSLAVWFKVSMQYAELVCSMLNYDAWYFYELAEVLFYKKKNSFIKFIFGSQNDFSQKRIKNPSWVHTLSFCKFFFLFSQKNKMSPFWANFANFL